MNVNDYLEGFKNQDKKILSKAITLVESTTEEHQKLAQELLKQLIPQSGKAKKIAITGAPGVGKSTFLENFGMFLINNKQKIAVLAVDPTSQISGGSILGDKTRMVNLSQNESAFIRPTPSKAGIGIGPRTQEVLILLDAFGFDTIFVETVGVGQTELDVHKMTDMFLLIQSPGAGDDLQGIKRGIMELADLVVVNKADGDLKTMAEHLKQDLDVSLHMLKAASAPKVELVSSIKQTGFKETKEQIEIFFGKVNLQDKRKVQFEFWLEQRVFEEFKKRIYQKSEVMKLISDLSEKILTSQTGLDKAVQEILSKLN